LVHVEYNELKQTREGFAKESLSRCRAIRALEVKVVDDGQHC
ncbi:MAG: hypothetical protein RLZZ435_1416, partial [Cyanobacteriota bacterium]